MVVCWIWETVGWTFPKELKTLLVVGVTEEIALLVVGIDRGLVLLVVEVSREPVLLVVDLSEGEEVVSSPFVDFN
ncbi:hypothetical protein NSMS1_34230 [Nostoc sp. MS1]|nr:hypothetical protein NSMS1_34230 [Nostoc sp. MS1]